MNSGGHVAIVGGYGVFGSLVARDLAAAGVPVTIAGRRLEPARQLAGELGQKHQACELNVGDSAACHELCRKHPVVVHAAGPFNANQTALLDACVDLGCHYVDIADDRAYAQRVLTHGGRFKDRGLTAAVGCSSLPGISGAAALVAAGLSTERPNLARVSLFIGNDNPKGSAAVRSAAALLGRAIQAPQGKLRAFGESVRIPLPAPLGSRSVVNFESPDYDLLPALVGARAVEVKVGFEMPLVTASFNLLGRFAPRLGMRLMPAMAAPASLTRWFGSSAGAVLAEHFWRDGRESRVAVVAEQHGQRMAALPAAYVAHRLWRGDALPRGAVTAYEALGPDQLLELLEKDGYRVVRF